MLAEETSPLAAGQTLRVRILEVPGMRHLVRREEILGTGAGPAPASEPVSRLDTAAGHFIARLPSGRTREQVLAGLPANSGITGIDTLAPDGTVLVRLASAQPRSLPDALAAAGAAALFDYVEPDAVVAVCATPNDPRYASGELWGLRNTGQSGGVNDADIDADIAWDTVSSAGPVIVAVIDTGLRLTHEDLAANLWVNTGEIPANGLDDDGNGVIDDVHGYNAITGTGSPADDHGHGSHCAGTIAGVGDNNLGVVGVAWQARLMAVKFLAANGSGYLSDAVRAIDYARLNGAQVMNNSWGGGGYYQSLADAIERTNSAGIVFVAAAGNNASSNDIISFYPANYARPNMVSVAATTRTDALASFSNFGGATVHLAAPGASIVSCGHASDSAYATLSGTSMAAPHVAGALALLRARFPAETPHVLIDRLLASADRPAGLAGRLRSQGRLNIAAALALPVVIPSPTLSTQPVDQTVAPGSPATFSVVAEGAGPFAYQWRRNGFPVAGATSASLTIPSAASADEGRYAVSVANSTASTSSTEARLRVGIPPAILSEPADQTLPPGSPLSLQVTASGGETVSYEWLRDEAVIPGAIHPALDLPQVVAGAYRARVSNTYGTTSSRTATVTVPTPPAITTDPAARSVSANGSTTFTAVATGSAPLAYQWFRDGAILAGATSASLTRASLTTADAGSYALRVTNAAGEAWTSGAALTVTTGGNPQQRPAVTSTPADLSVDPGASIALAPAVSGSTPMGFVWKKDGVALTGQTSLALDIPAAAAADSGTYTLIATNSHGAASSRGIRVQVRSAPVIVSPPAGQSAARGSRVVLEVAATGTAPLSFVWKRNQAPVPGATYARLVLPSLSDADLGDYTVTVSNPAGEATSTPVAVSYPAATPGAARWRLVHPHGPASPVRALATLPGCIVAGGINGAISRREADGTWRHAELNLSRLHTINQIFKRGDLLFAFGAAGTSPVLLMSSDGLSWTQHTPTHWTFPHGVDDAGFYGLGLNSVFARSTDGITWTTTPTNSPRSLAAVARGADRFVAVGGGGTILHSATGSAWSQIPALDTSNLTAIAHGHAGFVVGASNGNLYHSPDGLSWTALPGLASAQIVSIAYGSGRYVAVGYSVALVSEDGLDWRRANGFTQVSPEKVVYAEGRFYTANLLVSEDGLDWTDLTPGRSPYLRGLAATPSRQVAVGDGYSLLTSQNGREWVSEREPRSDFLNTICHGAGRWIAAGNDGNVYTSTGSPSEWTLVPVEAGFLSSIRWHGDRFLATAASGALLSSPDGLGWSRVALSGGPALRATASGGGLHIAIGDEGAILRSTDLSAWSRVPGTPFVPLADVAHGAGRFVALAPGGATLVSTDGLTWETGATGQTTALGSIAYGAGRFVTVGYSGTVLSSIDGLSWTPASPAFPSLLLGDVRFINGAFLVFGGSGNVYRSTDGLSWTAHSAGILEDIAWDGSTYFGVGYQRFYSSANAQTWTVQSFRPFGTTQLHAVVHAQGRFVSVGSEGWIETSSDGRTWSPRASGTTMPLYAIAHGSGRYVAVGSSGWRTHSTDGITWTAQLATDSPRPSFYAIVHNGQRFITGGSSGAIHTSEDGVTWTARASGITSQIQSLAVGPDRVLALGFNGEVLSSPDGLVWTGQTVFPNYPRRVFYHAGRFEIEEAYGNRHSSVDGLTWSSASPADVHMPNATAEIEGAWLSVDSSSAIRALAPPPLITRQPADAAVRLGAPAVISIEHQTAGPASISWRQEGVRIPGAETDTVSWTRFPSDAAGVWHARVTGLGGTAESTSATLTLTPHPADAWRVARFGEETFLNPALETSVWGWTADPDGDGASNLLDYGAGDAVHGGPAAKALEALPDGRLRLVFLRRHDDPGLSTRAETTASLDASSAWAADPGHVVETVVQRLDASTERVTAETVAPAAPARFLRVRSEIAGEPAP